jgi:hypothetical protein
MGLIVDLDWLYLILYLCVMWVHTICKAIQRQGVTARPARKRKESDRAEAYVRSGSDSEQSRQAYLVLCALTASFETVRLISHRSRLSQSRQTPVDSSAWLNIATQGNVVVSFILHASRQVLYATSQVTTGQDSSGWISCQSSCVLPEINS